MGMIQNVWFDAAATLAMGEAFDNACKSLQNFGSAAPAVVADRIIDFAKNGERDPARLYEQALKVFAIDDTSMLFVGVGDHPLPAFVAESSVALPPVEGVHHDSRKIALQAVNAPAIGVVLEAPPVLMASEHSVDYICGRCATILLHADEGQVHGVLIHCTNCGSYSSTG